MVLRGDFDVAMMSNLPGFRIVDTYKASKAREQKFRYWLKQKKKLGHKITRSTNKEGGPVQLREIPRLVQLVISRAMPFLKVVIKSCKKSSLNEKKLPYFTAVEDRRRLTLVMHNTSKFLRVP
jgi:hypothetical protein